MSSNEDPNKKSAHSRRRSQTSTMSHGSLPISNDLTLTPPSRRKARTPRGDSRLKSHASTAPVTLLWKNTVNPEVLSTLSETEIHRQELIYEIIETERTFVAEVQILLSNYLRPIEEQNLLNKQQVCFFFKLYFVFIYELFLFLFLLIFFFINIFIII